MTMRRSCIICARALREGQSHNATTCARADCRREAKRVRRRRWYESHRESEIAKAKVYATQNKDKINIRRRKNVRRQCLVCEAVFIAKGPQKTCSKTCRADHVYLREQDYRARNLGRRREQKRALYAANPKKFAERHRKWLLANPDKRERYREYKQQYYVKNLAKFQDYRAARYAAERNKRLEIAQQEKAEMLAAVRAFRRLCGETTPEPDNARRAYGRAYYAKNRAWISERRRLRRIENADAIRASERRHSQEQRAIVRTFRDLALTQ